MSAMGNYGNALEQMMTNANQLSGLASRMLPAT
jgi:hypothetical protein